MKRLALVALLLAGCTGSSGSSDLSPKERFTIRFWHDDAHAVSCWVLGVKDITCIPDSQLAR